MFFNSELHTKDVEIIKKANAIVQRCLFVFMITLVLLTLFSTIPQLREGAEYLSSIDSSKTFMIVLPALFNVVIYICSFMIASVLANVFFGYYYDHRCIRLRLEEKSNSDKQKVE